MTNSSKTQKVTTTASLCMLFLFIGLLAGNKYSVEVEHYKGVTEGIKQQRTQDARFMRFYNTHIYEIRSDLKKQLAQAQINLLNHKEQCLYVKTEATDGIKVLLLHKQREKTLNALHTAMDYDSSRIVSLTNQIDSL